jgi:hypothetical protein
MSSLRAADPIEVVFPRGVSGSGAVGVDSDSISGVLGVPEKHR